MNKQKIIFILLAVIFCSNISCLSFAEVNKQTKPLKASVADYKTEYINQDWWGRFNDPILKGYIFKTSEANNDLKIATYRVAETKEMVRESMGRELPSLGINSNFSTEKTSGNTFSGSNKSPSVEKNTFYLPLNVNYELDLWRKNRQKTLGMAKELEAAKYDEKAAYISLTSMVAATYFNVIKIDKLIQLQKEIIDLKTIILDLTKEKNNYGLCSTTDVIMADKAFTESQSALGALEKQQNILLNQLAVLTGESSDNSLKLERTPIDNIDIPKNLPLNVRSEAVLKRPDLLKAEAQLQKAKIDINLARKDFFPSIIIGGQFGFNSNAYSKAFDWQSHISSISAGVVQSIFTGGQRRARLKAKEYRYKEMFENYQKTILTSFQEVNDSIVSLKSDTQKNNDNISRINFEKSNLNAINAKYEQGMIAYLETLQYKERVLSLEKEQVQSKSDCLISSLSLYKALGGKL